MDDLEGAQLPTCQVCGEPIPEGLAVQCARCATSHHRDCWSFNGRCSTYGCGGTSFTCGPSGGPARPEPVMVIDEHTVPPPAARAMLGRAAAVGGRGARRLAWIVGLGMVVSAFSYFGGAKLEDRVSALGPRQRAPVRAHVVAEVGQLLGLRNVRDVAFLSPTRAIACLADGVYAMDDQGAWLPVRHLARSGDFWAVHFLPDGSTGWLAGRAGGLQETRDGGATWEGLPNASLQFDDVFFVSPSQGYALDLVNSARAQVMATDDGGRSWLRCPGSDGIPGRAVRLCFLNALEGFVASTDGYVYQTLDGGRAFTRVSPWFGRPLHGVCAWPDGRVAAAGRGPDLLLRTADGSWCQTPPVAGLSWVRGLAVNDERSFLVADRETCKIVRWLPVAVERGP